MKLLLTSSGIQNPSIAKAILDLTGLPVSQIKLMFIPTAMNVEEGEKDWLINDLVHFQQQGYEWIDIIDIAAVPKSIWQPRLEAANVICFGGGNEQYLARAMRETGFRDIVRDLLATRLYIGISAGSMVAGRFLTPDMLKLIYPEDRQEASLEEALDLVDLNFIPHFNSPWFPQARKETIEALSELNYPLYAMDDQSALKIEDGNISVVTEGQYLQR